VEPCRVTGLQNIAAIDLGELIGVDAENLGIAVLGRARGQAELVLEVENPGSDAVGVLAQ
jgi:hypothetical protein